MLNTESFHCTIIQFSYIVGEKDAEKGQIVNKYDLNRSPSVSHTFLQSASPEALTSLFLFAPCVNKSIIFCSGLAFLRVRLAVH